MRSLPLLVICACHAEAPPPKPVTPSLPAIQEVEPDTQRDQSPARPQAEWVRFGVTAVGPRVGERTILILAGKLAALEGKGSPRIVRDVSGLRDVALVPTTAGPVLVASDGNQLYKSDAELESITPIVRIEDGVSLLGGIPDHAVLSLDEEDSVYLLELASGAIKPAGSQLPSAPLAQAAFVDANDGVALFDGVGIARTADGGKTWAHVQPTVVEPQAIDHLDWLASKVVARWPKATKVVVNGRAVSGVSIDAKTGLTAEVFPEDDPAAAMRDWVRYNGPPLHAALQNGVAAEKGWALVASMTKDAVAHVDLQSGFVDEVVGVPGCSLFPRDAVEAWLSCNDGVRPVPRSIAGIREALARGRDERTLPIIIPPRGTRDDEVMPFAEGVTVFRRSCSGANGSACVVERSKSWDFPFREGARVTRLRDGRIAQASTAGTKVVVSFHSAKGAMESFEVDGLLPPGAAPLPPPPRPPTTHGRRPMPYPSRVVGQRVAALFETAPRRLEIVIDNGRERGAWSMLCSAESAASGKRSAKLIENQPPDRPVVAMFGRFGAMARGTAVLRSDDAGSTWTRIDDRARYPRASELGVIGEYGLVGWGEPAAKPAPTPPPVAGVTWSRPQAAQPSPLVIVCKSAGAARKQPEPKAPGDDWMQDELTLQFAKLSKTSNQDGIVERWDLRWFDERGQPHAWQGRPPAALAEADLISYRTRGDAAAFRFDVSPGGSALGLARGNNLAFSQFLSNAPESMMLSADGATIGWSIDEGFGASVHAWPGSGAAVSASLITDEGLLVSASRDRLWVGVGDHLLVLPLTAMSPSGARLPFDGWMRRDQLSPTSARTCSPQDKGDRVELDMPVPMVDITEGGTPPPFDDAVTGNASASSAFLIDPNKPRASCLAMIASPELEYDFVSKRGRTLGSDATKPVTCSAMGKAEYQRNWPPP